MWHAIHLGFSMLRSPRTAPCLVPIIYGAGRRRPVATTRTTGPYRLLKVVTSQRNPIPEEPACRRLYQPQKPQAMVTVLKVFIILNGIRKVLPVVLLVAKRKTRCQTRQRGVSPKRRNGASRRCNKKVHPKENNFINQHYLSFFNNKINIVYKFY